ncbi:MAG: thiamine diphosphokinase [Chloroflexia bacterium]|nr:thiamine diphosphokinase [Chloroflexia bacterium]
MQAAIIANGPIGDRPPALPPLRQVDLVIAANGGAAKARSLGLCPDLVIGDLDSLDPATEHWLQERRVAMQQHPRDKDETDLELALLHAARAGAQKITVLGALGGRIDQTLANLQLLAHPALAGLDVRLVGPDFSLFLLRGGESGVIEGHIGDTVSLLPLSTKAQGIRTQGLRWALNGDDLEFGPARGVSNELTQPRARVHLEQGLLLLMHLSGPAPAEQKNHD